MGDYLCSSTNQNEALGSEHIGSFRVKIEYAPCSQVGIIAQQIYNPEDKYWTFRKWNPKMRDVAYGVDNTANDVPDDLSKVSCLRKVFCIFVSAQVTS